MSKWNPSFAEWASCFDKHQKEMRKQAEQEEKAFVDFLYKQEDICKAFDFPSNFDIEVRGLTLSKKGHPLEIKFEFLYLRVEAFCGIMVVAPIQEEPFHAKTREEAVAFLRSKI